MNKNNISSIYIPEQDHKLWEEAEILARLLGTTRSKLICTLLRKVMENASTTTEVSFTNIFERLPERSRQILHELSNTVKTS